MTINFTLQVSGAILNHFVVRYSIRLNRKVAESPSKKGVAKSNVSADALQLSEGIARGFRLKEGEVPSALNGFLYSLLRSTKQQRRAIVLSMLKQFDENSKNPLSQLLYLADNLSAFPYQVPKSNRTNN